MVAAEKPHIGKLGVPFMYRIILFFLTCSSILAWIASAMGRVPPSMLVSFRGLNVDELGSLFLLQFLWCHGDERQRMNPFFHGILERSVDHAMPVHTGFADKRWRDNDGFIVVAAAGGIVHLDAGVREGGENHRLNYCFG